MKLYYQDQAGIIKEDEVISYIRENKTALKALAIGEDRYADSLGWLDPEEWGNGDRIKRLEEKAQEVRTNADAFVLIGVGGSNNSARSVIHALEKKGTPKVYYAGNTISAHSMNRILEELDGKSVFINVIAKNFETLEPGIAFKVLRAYLKEQYGEKANERIIATGTPGSRLHNVCLQHGYTFLEFPNNIGGRYSAICDVGLFPMAVAGVDIHMLVEGAKDMRRELVSAGLTDHIAFRYAAVRNLLYKRGYRIEMLSFFEPRFHYFAKWWIQLFAESEGKDGKGLFPVASEYSEDLHSVGQFVQDGAPVMFETFLDVTRQEESRVLQKDEVEDGFDYLNGVDFKDINRKAFEATVKAHSQCLPCFKLEVDAIDAYTFGQLFYFFEFACYASGTLLGINPFNQPGVEAYKKYMFDALGK